MTKHNATYLTRTVVCGCGWTYTKTRKGESSLKKAFGLHETVSNIYQGKRRQGKVVSINPRRLPLKKMKRQYVKHDTKYWATKCKEDIIVKGVTIVKTIPVAKVITQKLDRPVGFWGRLMKLMKFA